MANNSSFAAKDELFAIGEAIHRAGGGVFQLACEHANVPDELDWMGELSSTFSLPVMFNYSQIDAAPELWKVVEEKLKAVNTLPGAWVRGQVAGRAIGIMMALRGTAHPFVLKPSWLQLMHAGWEKQWEALQDAGFRQKLIEEEPLHFGEFEAFVTQSFDKMFRVEDGYEPSGDNSLAALAKQRGCRPESIALEILMDQGGTGMLYFPLFNYAGENLNVLEHLHQSPYTRMGLSDAGAHCGAICDGGMPTFMLTHWTRDRSRGPKLPLEYIVRRQTWDTASAFGLTDRGKVETGMRADLNVIDYQNLSLGRPELVWDLPAGGRRLLQRPSGYHYTLCRGQITVEGGTPTGLLPGRLIRRGSPQ